jgi:hypothetical protein
MIDRSAESSSMGPARSGTLLLVVAVAAIIVMPFVAGRHPSGAQTVVVLAASAALAAIALAVLAYGGRLEAVAQRRTRGELPSPDEIARVAAAKLPPPAPPNPFSRRWGVAYPAQFRQNPHVVAFAVPMATQALSPRRTVRRIVLVHGARAAGSSWAAVIRRLQAAGHQVVAPQLRHTSLADNVAKCATS